MASHMARCTFKYIPTYVVGSSKYLKKNLKLWLTPFRRKSGKPAVEINDNAVVIDFGNQPEVWEIVPFIVQL